MDEELHVVPNHMVLGLVLFEAILLAVESVPLESADEAELVLVHLKALFFLPDLGKLVDDNGANHLVHDHLDDEEVAEVYQDV